MVNKVMPQSPPLPSWLKYLLLALGLAAVYVVAARLGLSLALPPGEKATAVWPPSGIALAALLLLGYRLWPGIWLGAFLANFWDFFSPGDEFSLTTHLLVSAGIAAGSTLQPLLGAWLLRRWLGVQSPLEQAGSVFRFIGVGLLMCVVAATVGVTALYLAGFASLADYPLSWGTWWLGDSVGVLIVTPLILAWWKGPDYAWGDKRVAEVGILLGALLLVGWLVFGGWELRGIDARFLVYLTVPPLVWAAFRFGAPGATLGLALVTGIAVWGTAQEYGPFVGETLNESLLLLQTFMGVLTVMTLTLVGVLTERRRIEGESQRAREGLTDFIENATVGLRWVGPDGAILWANQAELDLLGYQREEYIGRHISEFHADPEVIDDILGRLSNYETLHDYEARKPASGAGTAPSSMC